jgi:peptidyl-tRNA hydrolase, PTH1 family
MRLIVGLGNPGVRYANMRHNAGFMIIDELAQRWNISFKASRVAEEAKHQAVVLIKPTTFMNLSGQAVQAYQTKLGIKPEEILLIHDDLDLPLGKLRIKQGGGGAGGQGGVKDTTERIGPNFLRLKLGIGRPPELWTVENWVLSKFAEEEKELLQKVIQAGADTVEMMLNDSVEKAMNYANGLKIAMSDEEGV